MCDHAPDDDDAPGRPEPDPSRSEALRRELLASLAGDRLARARSESPAAVDALLVAFCGVAPFFAPLLKRHPDWFFRLLEEDLGRPLPPLALAQRLDAALRQSEGEPETVLRRFKYYELARITLRDCALPLAESHETFRELSQLADALLDRALAVARERTEARWGPPRWACGDSDVELGFCAIALGKLGGEELNFSSDVDLVYVYEAPPDELRPAASQLHPSEYFTRLAQTFGAIVATPSQDGFLYRIDLDLRPAGAQGTIVSSDEQLETYYELWADTWEKATFTKARPVAGNLEFGWRTIRSVGPMIYRSAMDFAAVAGIRELKEKFEQARGGGESGFNVKLDSGGIRDVEFIAQALQLLHGARIPQVRSRSTTRALTQLSEVGLISAESAAALHDDYRFLRRLENRLQMEAERQVHLLPSAGPTRDRVARALGYGGIDAREKLDAELRERRDRVRREYAAVLSSGGAPSGADRVRELFARNAPQYFSFPASRTMIEELAMHFANAIDASGDPERALNNLDRFIQGIGGRRFYHELLLDRPELVPRLVALFAASKFLSSYLARHPRLIEPLFHDPNLLLLGRDELRADLHALIELGDDGADDTEHVLDALRLFQHRQMVNVGLLDLGGLVSRPEAESALSDIAELCVEEALDFVDAQLAARAPAGADEARFAVIAMGKLATRELTYGSDLDLIFLFDAGSRGSAEMLEAQEHFVRLTQRLISALQTPTAEGSCYEIDARLRPSGNQGTLVTSLAAFTRYHDESAQVWERQALLRARAIAGDPKLREAFEAQRRTILARPTEPDLAAEIHRIRLRMEEELARETSKRRNIKTGRGGVLDVECIVQYLQLRNGAEHAELLEVARTEDQIDRLEAIGVLDAATAKILRDGWEFLQRLSSRMRIVDNRSIPDIDQDRGELEGVALQLGYGSPGRKGVARRALLNDYQKHTNSIRSVYSRVLGAA